MSNYLDEIEASLKQLDIPYDRYKIREYDECIAYPSREVPRYSYQVEYCPCCGKARDAGLFDYTNEGCPPNYIHCTPESALKYIFEDWHEMTALKPGEWLRCRFTDEKSAMEFVDNLLRDRQWLTFIGPEYDVDRNDWEVLVENKEVTKNGTAPKT